MFCRGCKQGEIYELRIKSLNQTVYSCEECDATWFSIEDISDGVADLFGSWIREKLPGREFFDDEVEIIRKLP